MKSPPTVDSLPEDLTSRWRKASERKLVCDLALHDAAYKS